MIRTGTRTLLGILTILVFSCVPAAALDGDGIPESVDELLEIYGVADEPSDYVVVVDTSGSMEEEPAVYPEVREVYAEFTAAIGDQDNLAVITFDSNVTVQFSGTLDTPEAREAAANALPERAQGGGTDIGAALESALARMDRADAAQVQTLILLTDGEIVAQGSPYGTRGSDAWNQLTERAAGIADTHTVSVFGAGLGGGATDVDVVKDVFPSAEIVNLPTDQLGEFFDSKVQRAKVLRLVEPVSEELRRYPVQAVITSNTLADETTLDLSLDSTLPHLGATATITDVTVTSADGQEFSSRLVDGPTTVTVGPDRSSDTIVIAVEVPDLDHSVRVGVVPDERDFNVTVEARLEAEPSSILSRDLNLQISPELLQPDTTTASRQHGIPYWMIAVALGVLVLIGMFLGWLYRRFLRVPNLVGGIELPDGTRYYFRGKEQKLPSREIPFDGGGSSVIVFTKRGKFTRSWSTRRPRVFARLDEGTARHRRHGAEYPLIREVPIGPTDELTLGPTRTTVIPNTRKKR